MTSDAKISKRFAELEAKMYGLRTPTSRIGSSLVYDTDSWQQWATTVQHIAP